MLSPDQEEVLVDTAREVIKDDFEALFSQGLSPAEAVDYWATKVAGYTYREWSEVRQKSRNAVQSNVKRAREKLDE
jgi:DNA-directed RNA polymerase specialized sigma24 family protein